MRAGDFPAASVNGTSYSKDSNVKISKSPQAFPLCLRSSAAANAFPTARADKAAVRSYPQFTPE
jgi:hypothetical protein